MKKVLAYAVVLALAITSCTNKDQNDNSSKTGESNSMSDQGQLAATNNDTDSLS